MSRRRSKPITPSSVARQGGTARDVSTEVATMTLQEQQQQVPPMARLLPTPPGWASMPFGPGRPLDPIPINPVRADSGRPEPRLYEYPVTWNLSGNNQRLVPWSVLRSAADGVSLFRRCIEVRKDHMIGLDWDIVIGQDALDAAQRKADRAERAAKKNMPPKSPPDQATTSPTPPAPPTSAVPSTAKPTSVPSPPAATPPQTTVPAGQGDGATSPDQDTPASGRAAVEDEMRDRLAGAIDAAKKFLLVPDRGNGTKFPGWLGKLLEEVFVLDALAIYPRYTMGGDLHSLEIIDGSTVKPLLDERGGRPQPPFPAYQQWLYGFARGDFTATTSETSGPNGETVEVIDGGYASDELIYCKRVDRVWSPYGLSAVEQALDDGSLYLKRHLWMMSEYTDGTSVSGLFTTDEKTNWSPEQLAEYETWFNRVNQGAAERHQARFLPPFVLPVNQGGSIGSDAIAEKYKPEYDMYLLKLMVSHFDTTLPELGFTDAAAGGLGAAGWHEGQENVQMRKRLPIIKYVESLITGILHDHFGSPDEIEFKFLGLDDEDEPGASDVDLKRMGAGVTTLNEQRDKLGMARFEFPEADMAMISTGRGVIYLEGSSAQAPPGEMIAPAQPVPIVVPGETPPAVPGAPPSSPPSRQSGPAAPAQPGTVVTVAASAAQKAAEATAYKRWLAKGAAGGRRPFRWEYHGTAEIELLTKAGEVGPKAPWPGWSRDLQVMEIYAPRLSRALTGAIGAATLAARWAEHGGSPDSARAWLAGELDHGRRIAAVLTPVIHRVWTDGYLIGDISARFMLERLGGRPDSSLETSKIVLLEQNDLGNPSRVRQSRLSKDSSLEGGTFDHATDWGAWKPGDARAAAAILDGSGRYPGLAAMLERGDVTINSIASHRVDELANILSQAAAEGWGNGKTAAALRGVLDDPRWAKMVAITEVSRASSASSLARYRDNGVDAKSWMTADDQRVCAECSGNQEEGDIPIGNLFQSGDEAPAAHPTCRCSVAPGWLSTSEAVAAGGAGGFDLSDLAGLSGEDAGLGLADESGTAIEADTWESDVEEIRAAIESGEESRSSNLGGSVSGDVRRVVTNDGKQLVRKVLKDPYRNPDETEAVPYQRDAEVLGAQVARAVGLDAPAILTAGEDGAELWMNFMDGTVPADLGYTEVAKEQIAGALSSDQGVLMKLVNLLTDNSDGWTNDGNWLICGGDRIGMIDQSAAFQPWGPAELVPSWAHVPGFTLDGTSWVDNTLTAADIASLRTRLQVLERSFAALGREDWYARVMTRLDAIGRHARGTRNLL